MGALCNIKGQRACEARQGRVEQARFAGAEQPATSLVRGLCEYHGYYEYYPVLTIKWMDFVVFSGFSS